VAAPTHDGYVELAPIILERVITLSTREGDLVCDPFGGGGVTAYVAERLNRRWVVGELNDCEPAKERLIDLRNGCHPEWRSPRKRIARGTEARDTQPLLLL